MSVALVNLIASPLDVSKTDIPEQDGRLRLRHTLFGFQSDCARKLLRVRCWLGTLLLFFVLLPLPRRLELVDLGVRPVGTC